MKLTEETKNALKAITILTLVFLALLFYSSMEITPPPERSRELTVTSEEFTEYRGYGLKLKTVTDTQAILFVRYPSGEIMEMYLPGLLDDFRIDYLGMRGGTITIRIS